MSTTGRKISLNRAEGGFTLIEILVTLAIVAMLAAISIPSLAGFMNKAKESTYIQEAHLVYQAAENYISERHLEEIKDEYDFTFDITSKLCNNPVDSDENPLKEKLEGSITPESRIRRVYMETHNGVYLLKGMEYVVEDYVVKINYDGVRVFKLEEGQ